MYTYHVIIISSKITNIRNDKNLNVPGKIVALNEYFYKNQILYLYGGFFEFVLNLEPLYTYVGFYYSSSQVSIDYK